MNNLVDSIHFISLLVYIIALITITIFWSKVRHEKYWIGFPLTVLFLTFHEILEILNDNYGMGTEFLAEVSEIIGAIILTISLYFLIKELRKINFLEASDEETE